MEIFASTSCSMDVLLSGARVGKNGEPLLDIFFTQIDGEQLRVRIEAYLEMLG